MKNRGLLSKENNTKSTKSDLRKLKWTVGSDFIHYLHKKMKQFVDVVLIWINFTTLVIYWSQPCMNQIPHDHLPYRLCQQQNNQIKHPYFVFGVNNSTMGYIFAILYCWRRKNISRSPFQHRLEICVEDLKWFLSVAFCILYCS